MSKIFKGCINPAMKVEAAEDKYLITLRVDKCSFEPTLSTRDEGKFHIVASLFRHVFGNGINLSDIKEEDIYVLFEVPKKAFSKEAILTCESNLGLYFELSDDALSSQDEVTKYAPRVKVRSEE